MGAYRWFAEWAYKPIGEVTNRTSDHDHTLLVIGTALKMCIELSAKIVPRVSLIQLHPKNSIDPDFGMQIASKMDRITAEDRYEDMAQTVSYSGHGSSYAVNTASIRFGRVFTIPSAIGNSVTHALVAVLFHSFLSPIVCCSSTRSTCVCAFPC